VVWADDRFAHSFLEEAQVVPGAQTRPNLKIQEGCGKPLYILRDSANEGLVQKPARRSRSQAGGRFRGRRGTNWCFQESTWAAGGGSAVLRRPAEPTLAGLVRQIITQTALPRLRLSSIEPMDWDAELIELMAEFGGTHLARHGICPCNPAPDAVLRRCTGVTGPGTTPTR